MLTENAEKHKPTHNIVLNPYEGVDWKSFKQHKAALHLHTRQSDGQSHVREVVEAYRKAGFSIISITDHDWNRPDLPPEKYSPYPKEPLPYNYPANPTWPWSDYGSPSPEELGLVGIQGNELTYRHHINSYFCDYGVWYEKRGDRAPFKGIVDQDGNEIQEDHQLLAIGEKGGLAVINHPATPDTTSWWVRQPLEWYVERYRIHSSRYLIGMEVTNEPDERKDYTEGLWDQLLARFMPYRPVWGFGASDMHRLESVKSAHTVFLLNTLNEKNVRIAMEKGRFYFTSASNKVSYLSNVRTHLFPVINNMDIDHETGTVTIHAENCHEIKWISAPPSLEPIADYKKSDCPWPRGTVIDYGNTLNFRKNAKIRNYIRAELYFYKGDEIYRSLTNPWGIA